MSSTDLMLRSIDDITNVAEIMAASGYFTDARDAAQMAVKILAGREMGFGPFASTTGVHIIKGRPAVGANLMAAAVKAHPKYDYRVRRMDAQECQIEFFQGTDSLGVSTFTLKDAQAAGTQNLQKFARNMLFARAMSNGVRWFTPDVFMGAAVYTPEELGESVDEDGIIDVPTTPETPVKAPAPAEPTYLSQEEAQRLHVALGAKGVPTSLHHGTAEVVLARPIKSFTELTKQEATDVFKHVNLNMKGNANADE